MFEDDDNRVSDLEAAITRKDGFKIECRKCGSTDVVVFGKPGRMGSEYTGYMEGEEGFKCKKCGNAKEWPN
jgi:hypothetical protein